VQRDRVDALVNRAAETALAEWVAGRTVDEVLLSGKRLLPRYLVQKTQERIAPYRLGIKIRDADVTHLYPPADVKSAFDDVTRAQAEVQTEISKAQQDAARSWGEALAVKHKTENDATAYRNAQLLQSAAEVEHFEKRLAAYREAQRRDPLPVRLAVRTAGLLASPHGGPLASAAAAVPGSGGGQYLNALWWDEMSRLYAALRATGRIDVLDNYLSGEGLSIWQVPSLPKRK
jgi:membrane protease subunit HflK